ncbi:hypothetical protein NCS57_00514600 [Fusarium keratoplasticum]|uniref:Uncharacterized protein n=1 Tax=Fusarium keratoplasticum TaxID=1328300 RepID=A0ACC0QZM2_9HYPO|nr:hypothetical protein NCS57_00514600 [Fusarium keratoplasticum]KAI8670434.1 hypothetical protein NCS57_00514600 [Fusarium keratoplasticum]
MLVGEFLHKLYGGHTSIPVKYGHHRVEEGAGEQTGNILKLSLTIADENSMTLDAALQSFCQKFFDTSRHTACGMLSKFGIWMQLLKAEELSGMEGDLAAIRSNQSIRDWQPVWYNSLLFALSLGQHHYDGTFGVSRVQDMVESPAIVAVADGILLAIAVRNESARGRGVGSMAREGCQNFVQTMERVENILKETPAPGRPQMELHRDATEQLIRLFETGFKTVTVCKDAVLAFRKARTDCAAEVLNAARIGFGQTMRMRPQGIAGTPGSNTIFQNAMSLAPAIVALVGVAFWVIQTVRNTTQETKWAKVATYIAASMRIAQCCEVHLRWTYNSGVGNGDHSPQYYNELRNLMEGMEVREPLPEDCTPEAVRAKLIQYAETLNSTKEDIIACLH